MAQTTEYAISFPDILKSFPLNLTSKNDERKTSLGNLFYLDTYAHFMLCGSIALFGTFNNIINIAIFYRLGMKDSMSVELILLSFTDFMISFLSVSGIGYFIWDTVTTESIIDAQTIEHVSIGWLRDMLFLCSGWITTVLSMERCVCVVFPFKVKQIFTRTRSVVIVVTIYIVHISVYLPIFLSHGLVWTTMEIESANGTVFRDRLVVTYSVNRQQIQLFNDIFTGAISPFPSQIIVLISVIWMIYGLKLSSMVRSKASESGNEEKKQSQLSLKEGRLVKVVLSLAIILTLCNTPRFLAVYAKQIFPEVSFGKNYGNLYMFLWNMAALGSIVNSSVNIFVYITINKSYRQTLSQLFSISKIKSDF